MKKISKMATSKMRNQSKNFANSIKKDSELARKKSVKNSRELTDLNKKSKKKSTKKVKKNNEPVKEQVQEVKVHPSFIALFWIATTIAAIATLLGI